MKSATRFHAALWKEHASKISSTLARRALSLSLSLSLSLCLSLSIEFLIYHENRKRKHTSDNDSLLKCRLQHERGVKCSNGGDELLQP